MKEKIKPIDLSEYQCPSEKDYLIAYVDILGTKERLNQTNESEIFKNIYHPFLFAGKVAPIFEHYKLDGISIKVFSDNILFACPIEHRNDKDEVLASYTKLGWLLKDFLSLLAKNGILFRGAITLDKLYINELMVWGKGLLTVVDLEENVAVYPRILLSDSLLKVFKEFGLEGVEFEEKFSCLQDADDGVFFDFIDYNDFDTEKLLKALLLQIFQKIKRGRN